MTFNKHIEIFWPQAQKGCVQKLYTCLLIFWINIYFLTISNSLGNDEALFENLCSIIYWCRLLLSSFPLKLRIVDLRTVSNQNNHIYGMSYGICLLLFLNITWIKLNRRLCLSERIHFKSFHLLYFKHEAYLECFFLENTKNKPNPSLLSRLI